VYLAKTVSPARQDHPDRLDAEDYPACLAFQAPKATEDSPGWMELREMLEDLV